MPSKKELQEQIEVKVRDFIAFPFAAIAFGFLTLAIYIGSEWTALQLIRAINKK